MIAVIRHVAALRYPTSEKGVVVAGIAGAHDGIAALPRNASTSTRLPHAAAYTLLKTGSGLLSFPTGFADMALARMKNLVHASLSARSPLFSALR